MVKTYLRPVVNQTGRSDSECCMHVRDNDRTNNACMHIISKIKNTIVSTPSIEIKIRLHSVFVSIKTSKQNLTPLYFKDIIFLRENAFSRILICL